MAARIPAADLVADFRRMLDERWAYGAQTRTGQVDCSGAFVWAYQQHGRSVYHGSNRIAREETDGLIPVAEATVVPGMAAFKRRLPGDARYALPTAYMPGGAHHNGDLADYYHIGLIDADTGRVLNAQSAATGFVASPLTDGWTHVARLTQVAYPDEAAAAPAPTLPDMTVVAANGLPVNLRKAPSATAACLARIDPGTVVAVHSLSGDWAEITAAGRRGYMMQAFLRYPGPTLAERLSALEARVAALEGGAP